MVLGEGGRTSSAVEAIRESYAAGVTDEFMIPTVIVGSDQKPLALIRDGDSVLFLNFRADRAREITQALALPVFTGFSRKAVPKLSRFTCMTRYDEKQGLPVLFPPNGLSRILGQVISESGL